METIERRTFSKLAAAGLLASSVLGAHALVTASAVRAEDYPTRPVTIIVPFPAGGTLDGIARVVGEKLAARLGKPFVVENRPGAGSATGTAAVAKAAPDGYTLLMGGSSPLAINPALRKEIPYDPAKDFVPLALVAHSGFVLVVHPSLPVRSVPELVKLAKEKPGSLSYASGGPGSPQHICAEIFKSMAGIDLAHVPYKGGAPALSDVVGGHVPLVFADMLPALPMIAEGKVRALAVTPTTRVPSLPDVPPLTDAGVPGFDVVAWPMFAAPANTPAAIVGKLQTELKSILATPEMREWIVKTGMTPVTPLTAEELRRFLQTEIARWPNILERIGMARSQ